LGPTASSPVAVEIHEPSACRAAVFSKRTSPPCTGVGAASAREMKPIVAMTPRTKVERANREHSMIFSLLCRSANAAWAHIRTCVRSTAID
jgi:hypothetical protein